MRIKNCLCGDCASLPTPIDPSDLCKPCLKVYNQMAEDRAEETDWATEYRKIYPVPAQLLARVYRAKQPIQHG